MSTHHLPPTHHLRLHQPPQKPLPLPSRTAAFTKIGGAWVRVDFLQHILCCWVNPRAIWLPLWSIDSGHLPCRLHVETFQHPHHHRGDVPGLTAL
eukprot:8961835-Ditylum_brightwellii.AAC.1